MTEALGWASIHILDKAIANSITTTRVFEQHKVFIDRGLVWKMYPPDRPIWVVLDTIEGLD